MWQPGTATVAYGYENKRHHVIAGGKHPKIKCLTESKAVDRVQMQQDLVYTRTVPPGLNDYAESQTPGKLGGLQRC